MFTFSGPTTINMAGNTFITLYFDNITMTGIDQTFYVDLIHINPETGANIATTPSMITLEAIGMMNFAKICRLIHYYFYFVAVTISFSETRLTLEEGENETLILNVDTGVVIGNVTLMITDETTLMSKSKGVEIDSVHKLSGNSIIILSHSGLHDSIYANGHSYGR